MYRVVGVLCGVVAGTPIGTNLGLVQLRWVLVSGRLLGTRGAVIPGLSATGLAEPAVRRAWAALGQGDWRSAGLLARWRPQVEAGGQWRAHAYAGYRPVAVDGTGFWRPRLQGCATRHSDGRAGKARPAIPVGLVARVGSGGTQRLGLPLALVRAGPADPRTVAHERALVLATTLAISARALRDLYLDRWPVEQLPLAAKQLLGAARAFGSAPETGQRLPQLALLAGSILTYLAATQPAIPTGAWDRRPRPTPGRLRRRLAHTVFPTSLSLPDRIRQTAAVTAHLPTGCRGQRRRPAPIPDASSRPPPHDALIEVA